MDSCRYELHHWLIALHDARIEYKNTMSQCSNGSKKSAKQRSHSVAALPITSSSSKSKTYPRKKPTRPAPPAPPKVTHTQCCLNIQWNLSYWTLCIKDTIGE